MKIICQVNVFKFSVDLQVDMEVKASPEQMVGVSLQFS